MIQKKYMWGLVLGLLGSSLLVNDVFSMMRQGQESEIGVGSAKFNSLSEDAQISLLSKKYSNDEILKFIANKQVKKPGVISYFQRDQQQMTQTPENLYRMYQQQYQGQYWSDFYGIFQSVLDGMNIRSASDLERAARQGNEDNQGGQDLGGGQGNQDLGDEGGSEDKGKEEVSGSGGSGSGKDKIESFGGFGAGDSSVVAANHDEIAAAIQALLKLSEKLTLSKAISNQTEWKAFCNAFADLVERGKWNPDQEYTWDGRTLK
jgi:hypothetical protein